MSTRTIKSKIVFIFILIFAIFIRIHAQSPHFKNYNISKGKKSFTVNIIFQDHFGYIWFGTSEGLFRYDGNNYLTYTVDQNLAENHVTAINQDSADNIWIGHKNGKISILKNDSIIQYQALDSSLTEPISRIFFSKNETWISSLGNGLFRINGKTITRYNSENEIGDDYIYDLESDRSGNLWIGSDIGILYYDIKNNLWKNYSMKNGLPDNIIKAVEIDEEGKIWLGMEDSGIAIFDPSNSAITAVPMWKFGQINHVVIRNKGEIWISTRNEGVIKLLFQSVNSFDYKKFLTQNGLISNQTYSIFKDNEKNVWIGAENGVSLLTGDLFEFLNMNEGLPSNEIFNFIIDSKSKYWICTKNGLYILTKSITGEFNSKRLLDNLKFSNHSFTSVYEDSNGYIWVGTYGYGVYRFNQNAADYKLYNVKNGLANDNIISINGKGNFVWLSTFGGGVNFCDISKETITFEAISSNDGLKSNYIYSTYTDSKNRIWFAKDGGGLAYRENEQIKTFNQSDSISNVIYGIAEEMNGNIWFTTANQGILKFNGKRFEHFTVKDKLISNSFQSLIFDNYGNCIFAGNDGISVYDKESNLFHNYADEEGVSYLEPNLNAIFKDKTGDIWIGTNQGILKYNPDAKEEQKLFPKIAITSIKALDLELMNDSIELNYNQNNLEFKFIGLWYKAPEKLVYRYKLEGHDPNWSYETKSLIAIYSNLPPGEFIFKVQVSNEPGIWLDKQMSEFKFEIRPPFWKRTWFILSLLIIISTSIYLTFRLRLATLRRAKERLELEVIKRTAEIERQRYEIEIKNKNITDSIQYASRIQTAILPPDEYIKDTLPQHFILFKPRDIVSGDYYWMTKKDDEIVLAVADCTGHGVPGAFMSMLGVAFLNEIVNRAEKLVASNILNGLRDQVKKSLRQTGKKDEAKDGMDIALCVFDIAKKQLQFAGAYNPLYILRKGELIQLKADRMPIGIYYKEKESFTNHIMDLESDDVIYLFSDGYNDQFGGSDGKKFMIKQFQNLLIEIYQKPLDEQKEILNSTLEKWMGKHEQVDDILVIGFKIE